MCFSATASFAAGAVLSAAGVVTIKKTKTKEEIPFAAIPLLFGIQQAVEGVVWLSFKFGATYLNQIATYAFMFFAYLFWPTFVPFAIQSLETDPHRKTILSMFQALGFAVSSYLLYFIVSQPMTALIVNESITYPTLEHYGVLVMGLYLFATCGSCLFSSHRTINVFGVLVALSFAAAYYFYMVSFVSVWCFFGAVLSVAVYWYFRNER